MKRLTALVLSLGLLFSLVGPVSAAKLAVTSSCVAENGFFLILVTGTGRIEYSPNRYFSPPRYRVTLVDGHAFLGFWTKKNTETRVLYPKGVYIRPYPRKNYKLFIPVPPRCEV